MAKMTLALFRHRLFDAILVASPAVSYSASVRQPRWWLWSAIIISGFRFYVFHQLSVRLAERHHWSNHTPSMYYAIGISHAHGRSVRFVSVSVFSESVARLMPDFLSLSNIQAMFSYSVDQVQVVSCVWVSYWTGCRSRLQTCEKLCSNLWNTVLLLYYMICAQSAVARAQSRCSFPSVRDKVVFLFLLVFALRNKMFSFR